MQSGLYGDLPAPSRPSEPDPSRTPNTPLSSSSSLPPSSSWSSSASKMAPPTLRRASLIAAPPSVLRNQTSSPAASRLNSKSSSFSPSASPAAAMASSLRPPSTPAMAATPSAPPSRWAVEREAEEYGDGGEISAGHVAGVQVAPGHVALVGASHAVAEEYDPARPNDYEVYCQERRRRKVEEERERERERRAREEEEREREREQELLRMREAAESKRDTEGEQDANDGRAKLSISGEEAWKRRALLSAGRGTDGRTQRSPSPPRSDGLLQSKGSGGLGVGAGGQMTAAERMMAKMGWKAGQGLGRQEQGITTPLMARKTDKRAGVIVNASPMEREKEKEKEKDRERERERETAAVAVTPGGAVKAKGGTTLSGPPTRVLLLRNMVGPGEVDDELEEEVASECTKYGAVTRVLIFEITEAGFSATEAVRIFIQFERPESSMKALVDLDGRFFGGRIVRASFYEEERFARNELAPAPGEVPSTGLA